MNIPNLIRDNRSREYDSYNKNEIDRIVYYWLFFEKYTHRELDKVVLNLDENNTKGFQSMGILHYLGLKKQHKAIFKDKSIDEAIELMNNKDKNQFEKIVNSLDRYKNGHSYPKTFNSWEILNDKIALKTVDKSVLIHHGTGIPIQARYFFEIDKMVAGERKNINISYQNKNYEAYFELESSQTGRTRLLWYSDFRDILKLELPEYYEVIENSIELNKYIFPKIRFEKVNQYNFKLMIIRYEDILEDIESDNLEEELIIKEEVESYRLEGKVKHVYGKLYERNPKNRALAIAYHGTKCRICGFNFEEVYGTRGRGYIEIHHINPLSTISEETKINPATDLIPVCANCHRMIHRKKENILSIDEMKELVCKKESK